MKPKQKDTRQGEIFERELETLVQADHRLVRLQKQIDWSRFEREFGAVYQPETGRPGIATRLLSGITEWNNDLKISARFKRPGDGADVGGESVLAVFLW